MRELGIVVDGVEHLVVFHAGGLVCVFGGSEEEGEQWVFGFLKPICGSRGAWALGGRFTRAKGVRVSCRSVIADCMRLGLDHHHNLA